MIKTFYIRNILFAIFLIVGVNNTTLSQESIDSLSAGLDRSYREDQFYFGVTYNLLNKMPAEMAQNGFSSGFHFGFIRDFPINDERNLAIGLGIGYSANSINQNLQVSEDDQGNLTYSIIESGMFTRNKFSLHILELPIEFRWRSSTPETYKFWRIYAGFKIGYVFASSVKFKGQPKDYKLKGMEDFNLLQYGLTISAGYDKFNAHLYYSLNAIFKNEAELNGDQLDATMVKIGLMLYIL